MGCVYIHTNKINGKKYVGLTVFDIKKRLTEHLDNAKNGSELHFHRALRKYGIKSFTSKVLFESENLDELKNKEIELIREHNTYNKGYNSTKGGDGFFSKHTKESKIKMSNSHKELVGDKNAFYGKSHNNYTKKLMSEKKKELANKGFYQSDSFIKSLSYRKYKYVATLPNGEIIETINHKDIQKLGVPFVHNVAKSKTNICRKTGIHIIRVNL